MRIRRDASTLKHEAGHALLGATLVTLGSGQEELRFFSVFGTYWRE